MATTKTEAPPGGAESAQDGTPGPEAGADTPGTAEGQGEPRSIHQRMVAILAELPAIGKDTRNEQQNFMFRSHDAVLNALNPLLAKHGVYVVPNVLDRVAAIRSTSNNKAMYEVSLHVQYRFIAEDGSWIDASAIGEGTDMGDKATNKAMTMAFKNVLAQSFAVSTEDTQDSDAGTPQETVVHPPAAAPAAAAAPSAAAIRDRIVPLLVKLDTQTKGEKGTWHGLVEDGAVRSFEKKFAELDAPQLTEVGKFLKAQIDAKVTEVPEQIDFSVPF